MCLNLSYLFWCGYFHSHRIRRSHSASFWISLRGSWSMCSCIFGVLLGGGNVRSLMCHHLDLRGFRSSFCWLRESMKHTHEYFRETCVCVCVSVWTVLRYLQYLVALNKHLFLIVYENLTKVLKITWLVCHMLWTMVCWHCPKFISAQNCFLILTSFDICRGWGFFKS